MTRPRTVTRWLVAAAIAVAATNPRFTAASLDAGAGNWRMIVMSAPTQFAVAPPSQTNSLDYQAELRSIRDAQSRITADQKKLIEYWGSGGVLRWNEILLGLVARFNLPPAPNADNTYPVPDANNPFADPQFPFGNPPYAARAYSYVTVAQFEALKAAGYFKFLYNRPSPAKVDSGIQRLIPATDLPAYPSEDAVMSGVSAEMLKLLFPAAVREITLKAAEQRQAAQLSGKASASDIAAGLALGQAVATLFVARAGADGMRTAGGSPRSLMARELDEVRQHVDRGTREELAIANFWADGPSTPTPPGHWNFIAAPYIRRAEFSEVRAARAFALLNMALHDAAVWCWDVKYFYFNPRPSQFDVLGRRRRSPVVPLSGRRGRVRAPEGRSLDRAPISASTIEQTSKSGRLTARVLADIPSALPGPTAPTLAEVISSSMRSKSA